MQKVSLYIPCYNAEKYIARSIEGALKQTIPPDEILIIDDGCTDRTAEIVSKYPVRLIEHGCNKGLAAARNTAFTAAAHELVAALDADCVANPAWLEVLLSEMQDPAIVGAGGRLVETVLDCVADRWRKAHMTQDWGEHRLVDPPFMFGNNSLFRKSAVEKAGWYDEKLRTNAEDFDLSKRLREKGYKFVYRPEAVVCHLRQDSVSSILNTFWRYGCFAYFQKVNWWNALRRASHNRRTFCKFLLQDWKNKHYDLLWIDMLLPIYLTYRDFRLTFAFKP